MVQPPSGLKFGDWKNKYAACARLLLIAEVRRTQRATGHRTFRCATMCTARLLQAVFNTVFGIQHRSIVGTSSTQTRQGLMFKSGEWSAHWSSRRLASRHGLDPRTLNRARAMHARFLFWARHSDDLHVSHERGVRVGRSAAAEASRVVCEFASENESLLWPRLAGSSNCTS